MKRIGNAFQLVNDTFYILDLYVNELVVDGCDRLVRHADAGAPAHGGLQDRNESRENEAGEEL